MKINGSKVKSFNEVDGTFLLEDESSWYFTLGVQSLLGQLSHPNQPSTNIVELAKLGYSADDLVKMKAQGLL